MGREICSEGKEKLIDLSNINVNHTSVVHKHVVIFKIYLCRAYY